MQIVRVTKALSDGADTVVRWIAVPVMASYIFLTFAGVLARFIFKTPIMEAVIYSRLGFVWTCLLGATLAYKRFKHIRFTAIISLLPAGMGKLERIAIHFLSLGFMLWTLHYGIQITRRVWPSKISGTELSNGFMYVALPVALVVMVLHCIHHITCEAAGMEREKGADA